MDVITLNAVSGIALLSGIVLVRYRWHRVHLMRKTILELSPRRFFDLPSPDRMFWQVWRWSYRSYMR